MKAGFVYIMASARNGTIYVGATADLQKRVWEHRTGAVAGFTRAHNCTQLAWYEAHDDLQQARLRERQIKKWKRQWKLSEIEAKNPAWEDLYPSLFDHP